MARRKEKGPYRPGKGLSRPKGNKAPYNDAFEFENGYFALGIKVEPSEFRKIVRGWRTRKCLQVIKVSPSIFTRIQGKLNNDSGYISTHLYCPGNDGFYLVGKPTEPRVLEEKFPQGVYPGYDVIKIATKK